VLVADPRKVATDALLTRATRALRLYRTTRQRKYYDDFREAKRGLYSIWPDHKAKLLVRYAALQAGWDTDRVVKLGE